MHRILAGGGLALLGYASVHLPGVVYGKDRKSSVSKSSKLTKSPELPHSAAKSPELPHGAAKGAELTTGGRKRFSTAVAKQRSAPSLRRAKCLT